MGKGSTPRPLSVSQQEFALKWPACSKKEGCIHPDGMGHKGGCIFPHFNALQQSVDAQIINQMITPS